MANTRWYAKAIHLLTAPALVLCFGLFVVPQAAVYELRGGQLVRVSDWREAPSARDWEYE